MPRKLENPEIFTQKLWKSQVFYSFFGVVQVWTAGWDFGVGFCGFSFGFLGLVLGFRVKIEFCRVIFGFGVKVWFCGFSFDFLGLILGLGSIFLGFSFLCTLKFRFQFTASGWKQEHSALNSLLIPPKYLMYLYICKQCQNKEIWTFLLEVLSFFWWGLDLVFELFWEILELGNPWNFGHWGGVEGKEREPSFSKNFPRKGKSLESSWNCSSHWIPGEKTSS